MRPGVRLLHELLPILAIGAMAACSDSQQARRPVDSMAVTDDEQPDADAGTIAIPLHADPEELALPEPAALPLGGSDVLALSDGNELDMLSSLSVNEDGSILVVFDRSDEELSSGKVFVSRSHDGAAFSKPRALPVGAKEAGAVEPSLVMNPSLVRTTAGAFMYYTTSESLDGDASVFRRPLSSAGFGEPEAVGPIEQGSWLLSWPIFHARTDGTVGLAYRTAHGTATYATSSDGVTFSPTRAVPRADLAAMADAAELGNGGVAYTYQQGPMTQMVSYVTTSVATTSWSERQVVSDAANVHDTSMCRRADGGLDLYYIHPSVDAGFPAGFRLFRRALHPDGRLGPEERITAAELGEPSKPRALRLSNGRVLVSYAQIAKRGTGGAPLVQRIVLAQLPGEAP